MTREDAIKELEQKSYDKESIKNEKEYISNKLDINLEELENYLIQPKKNYKNFKNQSFIYGLGSFILKALGLEKGGKR